MCIHACEITSEILVCVSGGLTRVGQVVTGLLMAQSRRKIDKTQKSGYFWCVWKEQEDRRQGERVVQGPSANPRVR